LSQEATIHVGTSGWNYGHWKGPFYPDSISDSELLAYYADRFETVEVNNTFYTLPSEKTVTRWYETAPEGFVFAVKASRYITHMKNLLDPEEPVNRFLDRVSALEIKLGPVLFQLPPNWNCNRERLAAFLEVLPKGYNYAFEFRDPSWFNEDIYEMLSAHKIAFCMYYMAGDYAPKEITADWIYIRMHGPNQAYAGSYDTQTLAAWAGACSTWLRQGKDVYCYFNNDPEGHAPRDAVRLLAMLDSDQGSEQN
jgi:uncharacterized protein YecE (DUF72 family)